VAGLPWSKRARFSGHYTSGQLSVHLYFGDVERIVCLCATRSSPDTRFGPAPAAAPVPQKVRECRPAPYGFTRCGRAPDLAGQVP
jgi:hypothetical protein